MKKWKIVFCGLLILNHEVWAENVKSRKLNRFNNRVVKKSITNKRKIIGEGHITEKEEPFFDMKHKELFDYNTLLFTTPFNVKYNLKRWSKVTKLDIQYQDFYTYKQKHWYKIQDLGNEGTPAKFLYPIIKPYPGRVSGHTVFDIYKIDSYNRRFFDTHGPLIDGHVVFGNYGTFLFKLLAAQSINKNWHVSFTIDSLLSDREYVHAAKHDWQVATYPFSLNFLYKNDDETYLAFFSFYRKNHRIHETGGISLNYKTIDDTERNYAKWLSTLNCSNNIYDGDLVFSKNFIREYFIYHQYEFSKKFQIFNELKWIDEINSFRISSFPNIHEDPNLKSPQKTKKTYQYLSAKQIGNVDSFEPFIDKNKFLTKYIELGGKGDISNFFYEVHYKLNFLRNFFVYKKNKLNQKMNHEEEWFEHFVGGTLKYNISNKDFFLAQGDLILDKENDKGYCFSVQTGYEGRFGSAKYIISRHLPDLVSQFYQNNDGYRDFLRNWKNDFNIQLDQQIIVEGNLDFSIFTFRPNCSFILQKNPIVYKKDSKDAVISATCYPDQKTSKKSLFAGGLFGIGVWDNEFHWDFDVVKSIFAEGNKNVPNWMVTTRIYYLHNIFEDRGDFTCGVELNWNSPYYGDAYDPIIQRFYSQDFFEMYSYPLLGAYINFRIDKFRVFMKVINILHYLKKERVTYYASPFYPGQHRSFDFGVSWSMFN